MTTTAAAAGMRRYAGTYPAEAVQVRHARAALAELLRGCARADDAILIASEFATNSVLHSASRGGGEFTLRAEVRQDHIRVEVEDAGGPWYGGPRDDSRPHGFDVVNAIAGPQNWRPGRGHRRPHRLGQAGPMNGTSERASAPGLPLSQTNIAKLARHRGELERRLPRCPQHADRRETLRTRLAELLAEQTARRTLSR